MVAESKSSQEQSHSFATGDMVEVIEGELIHLQGKVVTVDGNTICVMPKHEDLKVSEYRQEYDSTAWSTNLLSDKRA